MDIIAAVPEEGSSSTLTLDRPPEVVDRTLQSVKL